MFVSSLEHESNVIYFDNAASTFPKPLSVIEAMSECMIGYAANPGRSGHKLSIKAGQILFDTRMKLAKYFGTENPMRVIFDMNATSVLNLAIKGFAYKGLHVITTSLEHNSTIRPLMRLQDDGIIEVDILQGNRNGVISIDELEDARRGDTKLLVINHASNVTGATQNLLKVCRWCRKNDIVSIVDASQSAGSCDIDINKEHIDILCLTGHKSMLGPMGVGAMIINDSFDYRRIKPLKEGGTGSLSDAITQPTFLPDIFESGTPNVPAIAALGKAIDFIGEHGNDIGNKKDGLKRYFISRAREIKGLKVYTTKDKRAVVSFVIKNIPCSTITQILSEEYNIMSRQGLHCSPLTHKRIGTFPSGTVRFSFSYFNELWQVEKAIEALKEIKCR
ncbi:MAG: aminotransferase class V-fold PLP-dependent enzyme [Sulfurovum sp.]|nr:aminotransferase class V-fold PLP-dependent enzyme [Sulfurovum sp.]